MYVDASREFEAGKNQNRLREQDIEKIVAAVRAGKDVEKYAHRAAVEEIKENEYNLNIARYVDQSEEREAVDLSSLEREIETLERELAAVRSQIHRALDALGYGSQS